MPGRVVFDHFEVSVHGADEVRRALLKLPLEARDEARKGMTKLSRDLANIIRAAGRADTRQSARAAATVRARTGLSPGVLAGPHKLLFGSEFGVKRRFGWYAQPRYFHSHKRQFRAHLGGGSYWFFRTQEREQPRVDREAQEIGDNIIRRWSA